LRTFPGSGKSPHGQEFHFRRNTHQFAVCGNRTCDRRAMCVRRCRRSHGIELASNDTRKARMIIVDFGIDDRDQHIIAFVDAMSLE
jgi:hypothetical protein